MYVAAVEQGRYGIQVTILKVIAAGLKIKGYHYNNTY
jgi:hypothetical protein